jgi:hypothetical protein
MKDELREKRRARAKAMVAGLGMVGNEWSRASFDAAQMSNIAEGRGLSGLPALRSSLTRFLVSLRS